MFTKLVEQWLRPPAWDQAASTEASDSTAVRIPPGSGRPGRSPGDWSRPFPQRFESDFVDDAESPNSNSPLTAQDVILAPGAIRKPTHSFLETKSGLSKTVRFCEKAAFSGTFPLSRGGWWANIASHPSLLPFVHGPDDCSSNLLSGIAPAFIALDICVVQDNFLPHGDGSSQNPYDGISKTIG